MSNLPTVGIRRSNAGSIELTVNGQKVEGVLGLNISMGELGTVATVLLNVKACEIEAEVQRLLLAGEREGGLEEALGIAN